VEGEDECLIVVVVVGCGAIVGKKRGASWFVLGRFNDAVVNVVALIKDGGTFFVHLILARILGRANRCNVDGLYCVEVEMRSFWFGLVFKIVIPKCSVLISIVSKNEVWWD
jgi:hypothetical protein